MANNTITPVDASGEFPFLGISMEGILCFIKDNGGEEKFKQKTTSEVNKDLIIFVTSSIADSYCKKFETSPFIGKATVFVSHAWNYQFLNVVKALQRWLSFQQQGEGIYFWFDLFSNSQHDTTKKEFTWWINCFAKSIEKIGHTVLVLEWCNPLPLTRMWCGWELACSAYDKVQLDVAMKMDEEELFLHDLLYDYKSLTYKTCNIDLRTAVTFYPMDEMNIRKAIEASLGFQRINKKVIGKLQEWMINIAVKKLFLLGREEREKCNLVGNLGQLYVDQGKFELAEPLCKEALEIQRKVVGDHHPLTLEALTNLGRCLIKQGNYISAELVCKEALDTGRTVLTDHHPSTILAMSTLGEVYSRQGKHELAETLYQQALEFSRTVLGNKHADTLLAMSNLGSLYYRLGKHDIVEPLFKETLDTSREILGNKHPFTLEAISNLGQLYSNQKRMEPALLLCKEALEIRRQVLGDLHPGTLQSMNNLGKLYHRQREDSLAEQLYTEALSARRKILGDDHPSTLISINNLGQFYSDLGKLDLAEPLCREAFDTRRNVLGAKHPDTIVSIGTLSQLYSRQGKHELSLALLNDNSSDKNKNV